MTTWGAIEAAVVGLAVASDGLNSILNNKFGRPRLTADRTGVQIRTLLGKRGAEWRSLSEFEVASDLMLRLWDKRIWARVLDANGRPRRFRRFIVPNEFQVAPETMAVELNALRGAAIRGQPIELPGSTPSPAAG